MTGDMFRSDKWACQETHLEDFLDGVDGGGEQRLHLLVVVNIVSVADAHEEDVSGQTGDSRRHGVWLDV